ncbi:TLR4 interactor with leucine rich repeats [Carcharodon carcharias]|uniref:TLR4 interactor with leucine rich repeats n=1 Tax=Carcharodon carcharias TaxID=13397 RepID=UPI001B7DB80C|nr:TLR4 interactor with leucine rich repeats [Carcharodon carcharias]
MESLWMVWLPFLCLICSAKSFCPEQCDCHHQNLLCTNRGLRTVPEIQQNAADVLTYSLGGNFISNVSDFDFTHFTRLLRLDLQYNKIQHIHPKTFEKLSRLEELYLGNNIISCIPANVFNDLRRLRLLNMNNNSLKKLNQNIFSHLVNLIKLRLDGNSLEILQDAVFKHLGNLLYLRLESNKIHTISGNTFLNLRKLTYLNLARNNQTSIHDSAMFVHLRSLTTLILDENNIKYLGNRVFQMLQKLSRLSLSKNKISYIATEAFGGLSGLRELFINGNLLREIPNKLLNPLEKLEQLDLSQNHITSVHPQAFKQLMALKVLKLKSNRLTYLPGEIFVFSNSLYSLDLSDNNWTCNCQLKGLKRWMSLAHDQGRLLTIFVQCNSPPVLSGRYLDYLTDSEMQAAGRADLCHSHKAQSLSNFSKGALDDMALSMGQLDVQSDQERSPDPDKMQTEKYVHQQEIDHRRKPPSLPTMVSNLLPKNKHTILPPQPTREVTVSPSLGSVGEAPQSQTMARDTLEVFTPYTTLLVSSKSERYYLLKSKDKLVQKPLITDPCEFNKFYITNLTVDEVTSSTATIRWKVAHPGFRNAVHFRVLFDRFGQSVTFHRFIYVKDRLEWVTLRELREETPYIVCLESVISDHVCQVASRDHCLGVLTLPLKKGALDVQHFILILSAANAFLVFLGLTIWMSRVLRKLRRKRAPVNVRRMYSTRRPLRSMGSGVSAGDCGGFQSNRSRSVMYQLNEADLMDFQSDRLMDINLRREDIGQRYAD